MLGCSANETVWKIVAQKQSASPAPCRPLRVRQCECISKRVTSLKMNSFSAVNLMGSRAVKFSVFGRRAYMHPAALFELRVACTG
jgi:hypothetical protein